MVCTVIGMTRRKFLLSVILMSTTSWLAGSYCFPRLYGSREGGMTVAEIKRSLLGLFGDLDSPRILGKRYLDLYPEETQRVLLLAGRIQSAQLGTSSAVRKFLAQQREFDFRNCEIVIIDGWLLSRTEVEVCALTVLL